MLKLDRKIIKEIESMDFASNFLKSYGDYEVIENLEELEKQITSLKWLNICLEERGNLTAYLCVNFKEEFQDWNKLVLVVKKSILPKIEKKLYDLLNKNIITKNTVEDVLTNITNIIVLDAYKEYKTSDFFKELLEIYKNGHIPCGWKGKYPKGKMCVY